MGLALSAGLPLFGGALGARSALQVVWQVVAWKLVSPSVITRLPWTERCVHLASPTGSKAKRSHLLGCHLGRQTINTRMEGQSLAQGHVNLETLSQQSHPPCS